MGMIKHIFSKARIAAAAKVGAKDGYALAVVIILALVSAVMVAAFLSLTLTEFTIVHSNSDSIAAFHIAEAGVEKGVRLLYEDFVNTPEGTNPSWLDMKFYFDRDEGGYTLDTSLSYFPCFRVLVNTTAYGNGTYTVEVSNVAGRDDVIWVRSTGTYRGKTRAILSKFRMKNINPWNNAIFAGAGQAGRVINGNVDIRGSVHILGDASEHGPIMEMTGSGYVGNNYVGMPWDLSSRVPSITKMVDGNLLETLDAEVRVRYGQISLDGTGSIGSPALAPGTKYTVDGTYVTDGFVGNQGASNVYSDNGTGNPYDIPDSVLSALPKITDPYDGYASYMDYMRANALVISDPADLNALRNITRNSVFSFSSANGAISMDGNGNLTISGMVVVEGDLIFAKDNSGAIEYSGSAGILVTGDIVVKNSVIVSSGATFPTTAIMGLMTPNLITFSMSQIDVQGVFYAENTIAATKQTEVTGTFFANYFDMGQNVPSIYQVPSVVDNLPAGMFGSINIYSIRRDCFREVDTP